MTILTNSDQNNQIKPQSDYLNPIPSNYLIPLPPVPNCDSNTIVNISSKKRVSYFVGLRNQGSTCYLDSLIQSLFMTPEFRYHLFQWKYEPNLHGEISFCIPFQLQKLFARLQEHLRDVEETNDLTKSFGWDYSQVAVQHDIEELCRVLFEAIELSLGQNDINFINDLYLGTTKSNIKCLECNNKSTRDDTFLDLSLPILSMFDNIKNKSLEMALMNYLKKEKLENDNQYNCSHCNKKVNALKYLTFEQLPKILFIQLGRFYYDFTTDTRKKINDRIHFPLLLNMNKFKKDYDEMQYNTEESESDNYSLQYDEDVMKKYLEEGPFVYELFSIVVHSGTANGGHYYAYIKSFEDGKWYNFNDSNVYEIEMSDISKVFGLESTVGYHSAETGYCLMYRKINPSETRLTIKDLKIDEHLNSLLKEENDKIIELEKIRITKLMSITLNIYYNNTKEKIETMKNVNIKFLKKAIMSKLNIDLLRSNEYRLREYDSLNSKPLDYFNIEDFTIEDAFITSYKAYTLQHWDEQTKEFPNYDHNLIELKIHLYQDDLKEIDLDTYPFQIITISNRATVKEMIFQICSLFNLIDENNFFISKRVDFGLNNNLIEISKEDIQSNQQLFLSAIFDRMKIYIEFYKDNQKTFNESCFVELFKQSQEKIKIEFNLPIKDSTENVIYDGQITLSKYDTINEVKKKICKSIGLDPNVIIMKKDGKLGTEIIEINDHLLSITKESKCRLYLEYGKPLQENELLVKVCLCKESYEIFNMFPYLMSDIEIIKVDQNQTIKELIPLFIAAIKKKHDELIINEKYCLIRLFASGKPTKILCNDEPLSKYNLYQNVKLLLHEYKREELHSFPQCLELSIRFFNTSKWSLSEPIELLFKEQDSVKVLHDKIIHYFPEITSDNIQVYKIANGYSIYLNNLLNVAFINVIEYFDGRIDQYPFFIKNDGYMLIVRDKSIEVSEASEEVKKWAFQCENNIPPPPMMKFNNSSGNRVKNMIYQFENGDFDIVTHTPKIDTGEKKVNRIKEKGIVIKVKKLEGDEIIQQSNDEKSNDNEIELINNKSKHVHTQQQNPKKDTSTNYDDCDCDGIEPLI